MMKRRVILFGTLVGVCLIGFLTAVILSGTGNGTMAIVERTRNGDVSEAKGLEITFDGEKLAEVSFYTTDCLINVSVYSAEGLLYRGEIAHSYYPDSNQETGDRYPQMKILQCRWNR